MIRDIKHLSSHSFKFLLSDSVEETLSKKSIKIRKFTSKHLSSLFSKTLIYKFKVESRGNLPPNSGLGRIYAFNHHQSDDAVLAVRLVDEGGYLIAASEDPYPLFETESILAMWTLGLICVDRGRKTGRKATYDKMKFVLENGGNIIIFPEGYYNLGDDGERTERHGADGHNSDSWLFQEPSIGIFNIAQELGCEIVPSVLHYEDVKEKVCYGRLGQPIQVSRDDDIFKKKDEYVEAMQGMLFELIEKYSFFERKDLEEKIGSLKEHYLEHSESIVSAFADRKSGFRIDLESEKLIAKAPVMKPVTTNKEAFEHLGLLNYTVKTAFLLSRRTSGLNEFDRLS